MTTADPTPRTPAEALDLDAVEARANAATDGPWDLDQHRQWGVWSVVAPASDDHPDHTRSVADRVSSADAEFIAGSREWVPALVAEVRRQAAELDRIRRDWWKMQAFRDENADRMVAEITQLRAERDMLARAVVHPQRVVDATELDTAPAVYVLPAEPPPEVTEMWDRSGVRFRRTARLTWEVAQGNTGVPWHERWNWVRLLAKRGPLSTTPPAGTEAQR